MANGQVREDEFTLSYLRNKFRDLARPNRFKVTFFPPQENNTLFTEKNLDLMSTLVKKVNIPQLNVQEWIYERAGKKLHLPLYVDFSDIIITFHNDVDYKVRHLIYNWQLNYVNDWPDYSFMSDHLSTLAGQIEIYQYDNQNSPTGGVRFTNCWPKTMDNLDFSHDADNQTSEFSVSFVYTDQEILNG